MSDDLVRKVARAIYHAQSRNKPYRLLTKHSQDICEAQARAAIEAMRTPTLSMLEAAKRVERRLEGDVEVNYIVVALDIWPKMIDAALSPPADGDAA